MALADLVIACTSFWGLVSSPAPEQGERGAARRTTEGVVSRAPVPDGDVRRVTMYGWLAPSSVQSWASPASVGLLHAHVHTTFDVGSGLASRPTIDQGREGRVLVLVPICHGASKVADSAMVRISSTRSAGVAGLYVASRITIDPSTSRIHSSSIWPAP